MRVTKDAEIRKAEILDAAIALFATRGYTGTSVTDIVDAVGIAKGTFYHHFESKEQVMEAIIDRLNDRFAARARQVASDHGLSVPARIGAVFSSYRLEDNDTEQGLLREMHKPENAMMHQQMAESSKRSVSPILVDLMREGIERGDFDTEYPEQVVDLIVTYVQYGIDDLPGDDRGEGASARHFRAFVHHIELICGAKPGTFDILLSGADS